MKNVCEKLKLNNDEEVTLSISFAKLLMVRNQNEELYDRFMKILQKREFDIIFDSLTVLYVGYLCEHLNDNEKLSEVDFMDLMPFDIGKINIIASKLIQGGQGK